MPGHAELPFVDVEGVNLSMVDALNLTPPRILRDDIVTTLTDAGYADLDRTAVTNFLDMAEQMLADPAKGAHVRAALGIWAARAAYQAGATVIEEGRPHG